MMKDYEDEEDELSILGITALDQSTVEKSVQDKVEAALAEHAQKQQLNILQRELRQVTADIEAAERSAAKQANNRHGHGSKAASHKEQVVLEELNQRLKDIQAELSGDFVKSVVPEAADTNGSDWERLLREGEVTPFSAPTHQLNKELLLPTTSSTSRECQLPSTSRDDQHRNSIANLKNRVNPLVKKRPREDPSLARDNGRVASVSQLSVQDEDSPLKKSLLQPKKRPRLLNMGTDTCEYEWDNRIKPGKLLSETSVFKASDDELEDFNDTGSDYRPSDDNDFSDYDPDTDVKLRKNETSSGITKSDQKSKVTTKKKPKSKIDSISTIKRCKDDSSSKNYEKRLKRWRKELLKKKLERIEAECEDDDPYESYENLGYKMHVPSVIWSALYRYQQTGVQWLWELHEQGCGGILGDEMGLGKTVQLIAFLAGLRRAGGSGPVLIVCPATILHQWLRHFHLWWAPFRVAILHGSGGYAGDMKILMHNIHKSNGVLITSYSGARTNIESLIKYTWQYVVLDEGHQIRNPESQIALALKQFNTPHRIILSGSPIQNSLKELWSLFDFVFPGKLGTLQVFLQQFSVPITQGGYANASRVEVETGFKCATVLRDTISPFLLRRMKADVKTHLNLPNKSEQVLFCGLTDEQRSLYKGYLAGDQVTSIMHGRLKVFVGLINLRKLCNHPDLYSGGPKLYPGETADDLPRCNKYGWWEKSGKMQVVHDVLQLWHKQDHRVLLFTQSAQMMAILELFLKQQDYKYLKMNGKTVVSSRHALVEKFNSDQSVFVFLLTTRVGGLGVNLTGADRVLIYDPDWNPSTDTQARERAWRIGQLRNVTIYRLLTAGTIEEKIYHRQIFKQFLTNRVLKDPKQQRFFKSNDLFELFTLNECENEKTESAALFAGLGSDIKVEKSKEDEDNKNIKNKSDRASINSALQSSNRSIAKKPVIKKIDKINRRSKNMTKGEMNGKETNLEEEKNCTANKFSRNEPFNTSYIIPNRESDLCSKQVDNEEIQYSTSTPRATEEPTNFTAFRHDATPMSTDDAIVSCSSSENSISGDPSSVKKTSPPTELTSNACHDFSTEINKCDNSLLRFPDSVSNLVNGSTLTVDSPAAISENVADDTCAKRDTTHGQDTKHSNREDTSTQDCKFVQDELSVKNSKSVHDGASPAEDGKTVEDVRSVRDVTEEKVDPAKEKMRLLAKMLSMKISNKSSNSIAVKKSKTSEKNKLKPSKERDKKGKKFEGTRIKYLIKKRHYKKTDEDKEKEAENKSQNDYVLSKLFKSSGVHTALSHDVIVGSNDADYLLMESEAERVAKDALKIVRASRSQCFIPTLPSNFNSGPKIPKKRFGSQNKTSTTAGIPESSSTNIFARTTQDAIREGRQGSSGVMSSSELLMRMKTRNRLSSSQTSNPTSSDSARVSSDPTMTANVDLLSDIRNFVAFQALVDGRASTEEMLNKFRDQLPKDKTHVFKALLKEICEFRKDPGGAGMWYIKREFQ